MYRHFTCMSEPVSLDLGITHSTGFGAGANEVVGGRSEDIDLQAHNPLAVSP